MMKHLDRFLSQLEDVAKGGSGWKARCPCSGRGDKGHLLSISASAEDGRVLVHCLGGCTRDAILEALGLDDTELYPKDGDLEDAKPAESDSTLANQVYSALLSKLSLTGADRQKLQKQGLTDKEIERDGYRSLTFFDFRNKVVPTLRKKFGERLLAVPGFISTNGKVTAADVPPGIVFPVRDDQGRVAALKIQTDGGEVSFGGEVPHAEQPHEKEDTVVEPKQEVPAKGALKGPDHFPYGEGDPQPFPLDFFPEALQRVVQEISTAVNSPADLPACAMVSAAATAIGRSRQLEPKEDWKICPRLYVGLVCDPGSGKSPALAKVMRPLWRKNREWEKDYEQEREIYEDEKLFFEARRKEIINHVAKNNKQGRRAPEEDDTDAFDEAG
jgi:hypothetical protein